MKNLMNLITVMLLGVLPVQAWADAEPTAVSEPAQQADTETPANYGGTVGSGAGKNIDPGIPPVGNVNGATDPRKKPNGVIFAPSKHESTYDFLGVGGSGGSGGNGAVGTGVRMKW
ncbi:MAG: hypothetical protein LBE50_04190 [Gallionellaceae bacterium]|jgi:hypothetical protein|nr:hypothetical protein [Gallionellaceae bacterium]